MPLKKGPSKAAMSHNYKEETKAHPNMKRKQKVAIMLSEAGLSNKKKAKKK